MIDLKTIRDEIDLIDQEIQRLFEKRMELSSEVADYKIATGKPVFDKVREEEKLEVFRNRASSEFNATSIQELFKQIMGMSRKYQYQLLASNGKYDKLYFRPVDDIRREGARIVYQGVKGAYSYGAMVSYFGTDENSFCVAKWRDAMEALANEEADYAVLPIENSTAGSVYDNYDLLKEYNMHIVGEEIIRCEHVLMGCPGTSMEDIQAVYSHPQALAQCYNYLHNHDNWKRMQYSNTAAAAKMVSESGDHTIAAIASPFAASVYELDILARNIYDNLNNSTRFIIVSKEKIYKKDAKKISICIELPHESGSLYNILSHIIFNSLNMTKIESRPIHEKNWEYRFFIDFEGNLMDSSVRNALYGIEQEASWMRIIGNY